MSDHSKHTAHNVRLGTVSYRVCVTWIGCCPTWLLRQHKAASGSTCAAVHRWPTVSYTCSMTGQGLNPNPHPAGKTCCSHTQLTSLFPPTPALVTLPPAPQAKLLTLRAAVDHLGEGCTVRHVDVVATLDAPPPLVSRGMATRLVRDRQVGACVWCVWT